MIHVTATIADNVDNVGDVAGMGADLFGSYATVLASMVLGNYIIRDMAANGETTEAFSGMGPILLPLVIAGVGVLASIIGTFLVIHRQHGQRTTSSKGIGYRKLGSHRVDFDRQLLLN